MHIDVKNEVFLLKNRFNISRGAKTQADVVTVTLSEGGYVGRGECVPYARYGESIESVMNQIKALPADFDHQMLGKLLGAGAARNAVDCALWDLQAKKANQRIWQLLGMPVPGPRITAYTLSLDAPEAMEAQAAKNAFRPVLKIKLGTEDDMPRLEAVRRGAPSSEIIIDANEGWSIDLYSELCPHLVRLGVSLVEQPLAASADEALSEVPRPVPVCADESCHDRASLAHLKGKYDVINIKLDKTGGLTEAMALATQAKAEGYKIMVGCMVGSSLGMAPATLIAQNAIITDLDGPLLLAEDRANPLDYDKDGVHPPKADLWG